MKKLFTSIALVAFGMASAFAQSENTLYIEELTAEPGTTVEIPVCMKNAEENIQTVGVKIFLPEGLEVPYNEDDEEYEISLDLTRTTLKKHSLAAGNPAPGQYNVGILGYAAKAFKGTDGAIFTMKVKIDASVAGTQEIHLKEVELTTLEDVAYKTDDVLCTLIVGEATGINNVNVADNAEVYNLAGQKLSTPQRGVNIIGGKKFMVK